MLLGLSNFSELHTTQNLEKLIQQVKCDVVVFRQPYSGWKIGSAKKILIPVTGVGSHDTLRARVLGSLWRTFQPELTFFQVLPLGTAKKVREKREIDLRRFSNRIIPGKSEVKIILSNDIKKELLQQTVEHDMFIMGLGKAGPKRTVFGDLTLEMAEKTDTALLFISHY